MSLPGRITRVVSGATAVGSYGPFLTLRLPAGSSDVAFQIIATSANVALYGTFDVDEQTGVGSSWTLAGGPWTAPGVVTASGEIEYPAWLIQANSIAPGSRLTVLAKAGR